MNKALTAMGMVDAFSGGANFSGMTGDSREFFISDVLHKAFVSVDEKGTEAAAATAVMITLSAEIDKPIPVIVDRPFIFLVYDIETGTILFIGRVMDPTV